MGNCFCSPNFSYVYSSTATQETTREYSNGGRSSMTSSSTGVGPFISALINGDILPAPDIRVYNFADLKKATRNFRSDSVLGEGCFGTVYKGWVDETTLLPLKPSTGMMMIAIKKLNSESTQGFFDEWQAAVDFLGKVSHPNLVKLLGYCWEDKELLLVYEFMQKGSLENHLFRGNAHTEPLPWDIRLRIAIGAARGLAFLHSYDRQVIYGEFKTSNILLDGSYNAKISDFGLAKLGARGGDSHGYATGHIYVKNDVYGFGIVLLEMLTGLRALNTERPNDKQNLVDWVKPIISSKQKLKKIVDACMEGQYSSKAALQAAQLTLRCLEEEPKNRPPMQEVVELLERIASIRKPKEMKTKRLYTR